MPVSFTKAQSDVLIDLNNIGSDQDTFQPFGQGGAIETYLLTQAAALVIEANKNLIASDRIASGNLADSIAPKEPVREGNSVYVDVQLRSYYKYVDRGAKYTTKQPPTAAIAKWLRSEGNKQRNNPYKPISRRESKRSTPKADNPLTIEQRAFLIARAIKEKGLKPSYFWTKAIAYIQKNIENTIGEVVKIEIVNSLR